MLSHLYFKCINFHKQQQKKDLNALTFSSLLQQLLVGDEVWGEFQVQGVPWCSLLPGGFRSSLATRDSLVATKQQVEADPCCITTLWPNMWIYHPKQTVLEQLQHPQTAGS